MMMRPFERSKLLIGAVRWSAPAPLIIFLAKSSLMNRGKFTFSAVRR